jgi:cell wall-associated NlpC family hydrolase
MVSRSAHRASRPSSFPRVASLGLVAATAASPFATAVPALATPSVGGLAATPLLPTTPLPTTPIATTPLPATPIVTTPLPATPTTTVTRWVTVGSNVRSGPGTSYSVVGGLSAGTRVTGTYTSNNWLDLGNGRFVAGSLLTATDPGGSTPAPPSETVRWVTVGSNVRSGPGTSYPVVGGLSAGTRVTGTLTSNGWFDMGNNRFVAASLLTATDPGGGGSDPAPAPPQAPPTAETRWVSTGANVRSGPGTQHPVVGGLSQGTQISGSMTSNNWFDLGNGRFVYGPLTTTTPPSTTPPPAPAPPQDPPASTVTRWASTTINVRSGPGTNHAVVGALTAGTQVSGAYTSNNWFDLGNGRFVAGWLLAETAPGEPAPAPAPGQVTGAAILAEAAKYAGVPYLWGGSTPAGFDCSGFTTYVFAQLGISLPRTAAQQKNFVTPVSEPRPGDLVFYGSPAYHVGIYAGNNTMWDSARPGTVVSLRTIWDSGDLSYGRIPGVSA